MRYAVTDYMPGGLSGTRIQVRSALLQSCRRGDDVERWDSRILRLDAVADNGGQIVQQSLKAVHRQIVWSAPAVGLLLSGGRTLGRRHHRGAQLRRGGSVVIVKQQGGQILTHVPLHVVSQHTEEDVSAHAIRLTMVDGAHV